jgi:hypothetical protein
MKKLLLFILPLAAFATPLAAPPDYVLIIPRFELVRRIAIEEQYFRTIGFGGNEVGKAYFEGRLAVYRELIALGDFHFQPSGPVAPPATR